MNNVRDDVDSLSREGHIARVCTSLYDGKKVHKIHRHREDLCEG